MKIPMLPEAGCHDERKRKQGPLESTGYEPSVLIPLFKTYKLSFISGALLKLIFDLLQFVAPALLKQLISFIQVLEIRKREINVLKRLAFLNAATTLSWACAPFLVAVLSFALFVTIDPDNNILTPQVTFVALALFNILRFPLAIFAMIFSQAVQCRVSNKRLRAFFAEEEMDSNAVSNRRSEEALRIENGTFSWEAGEGSETLQNINLSVKRGQLVAIVGKVGSGKSSLLQAILGEMNKTSGSVNVSGSIAYVPQQAWIQNLTLRDNILFSRPYDRLFYDKVVDACALRQDLASLPAEDFTEIGEKVGLEGRGISPAIFSVQGINLSGGQKQRVSLARAAYSHADIVLLDDPLSAVDSHVGKHIFEHVISTGTGLLSNTTRILVTHGLHYLKYCDKVVVMLDGKISEMGTYQELIARQGAFSEFLEEFLVEETKKRGRSVSFGETEKSLDSLAEDVSEILQEMEKVSPGRRRRIESQMSQEIVMDKVNLHFEKYYTSHSCEKQLSGLQLEKLTNF
ncbi:ABC transporter, ATP-binding protein [Oesophagostomum dentatum]|uniref:ABC transporter, ATP-binding protein n=1 Tax=Oesophagostomum dentatum TaxID=61180 RepID=A0A0B1SR03_OESDE|nr:ABC transporter, ATP-binding protein [Oesophagostomum dentatum]